MDQRLIYDLRPDDAIIGFRVAFRVSPYIKIDQLRFWCKTNVGDGEYVFGNHRLPGAWRWMSNGDTFFFKMEKDAMLFYLRWQGSEVDQK